MKIYKVTMERCSATNSDMFSYCAGEEYFINKDNAKKFFDEKKNEYKKFNDANWFDGIGEYYQVNMQTIETTD